MTFRVQHGEPIPDQTKANIKLKTLLGTKYLDVVPAGSGKLASTIPVTRTTVPYEIYDAFDELTEQTDQIDTTQLATSTRDDLARRSATPRVTRAPPSSASVAALDVDLELARRPS